MFSNFGHPALISCKRGRDKHEDKRMPGVLLC